MKNLQDFIYCVSLLAGITCHVGQEVLGMLLIIFENTVVSRFGVIRFNGLSQLSALYTCNRNGHIVP